MLVMQQTDGIAECRLNCERACPLQSVTPTSIDPTPICYTLVVDHENVVVAFSSLGRSWVGGGGEETRRFISRLRFLLVLSGDQLAPTNSTV